jgi:predicted Fe-Mo cluster-binding NifX family protein
MTVIPLENDKKTISQRFRKTDYFALIEDERVKIIKNLHKTSKSKEFFENFQKLGVKKLYIKALGYKTFLKLESLGIEVYIINDSKLIETIDTSSLTKIEPSSAESFCTLGHKKK